MKATEIEIRSDAERYVERLQNLKIVLEPEEDLRLWRFAMSVLMQNTLSETEEYTGDRSIFLQVSLGRHWLRPHQTRWKAAGGFAWPSGYSGSGFSRLGVPEPEGFTYLELDRESGQWSWVSWKQVPFRRCFLRRVVVPARTGRHHQSAIHTIWNPAPPCVAPQRTCAFYGFQQDHAGWELKAYDVSPAKIWAGLTHDKAHTSRGMRR